MEVPKCTCGLEASCNKSRKSSSNGKWFYGCPLYTSGKGCGYFAWLTAQEMAALPDTKSDRKQEKEVVNDKKRLRDEIEVIRDEMFLLVGRLTKLKNTLELNE